MQTSRSKVCHIDIFKTGISWLLIIGVAFSDAIECPFLCYLDLECQHGPYLRCVPFAAQVVSTQGDARVRHVSSLTLLL